jgi:pimeloyl-ACP methyl ester carboxylesterase
MATWPFSKASAPTDWPCASWAEFENEDDMSAVPPNKERGQFARPDKSGYPTFEWTLTSSSITDTVKLVSGPFNVLPVVFVPGIMGSNLKTSQGKPVWRLDTTLGVPGDLVSTLALAEPGERQVLLHPARCEVDDGGAVPSEPVGTIQSVAMYKERGWGTVGQGSYHDFLMWLEQELNPMQRNPAMWPDYFQAEATIGPVPPPNTQPKLPPGIRMGMKGEPFGAERPFQPIMSDDLIARGRFMFPVHAFGYNWLATNEDAASRLKTFVEKVRGEYNKGAFRCEQVLLVTHSMGGLVARACAQLPGMSDRIAGVVHGVMPAVGAAVAYRRCKLGMREEDFGAGLVIGSDGQEVTAVFAQAPGALQLLPSQRYRPDWLRVAPTKGQPALSLPKAKGDGTCDPYDSIYACRDKWWGLINEAWLAPSGGMPITWETYITNLNRARDFHAGLKTHYHPNSYVYYGADAKQPSFETVTWRVSPGLRPDDSSRPAMPAVLGMRPDQLRMDGTNPEYVGGKTEWHTTPGGYGANVSAYETSHWEIHGEMQDGAGDGTVPASSGSAPLRDNAGAVRQQFKLTGFAHEPAYKDGAARRAVLYAITKIAGVAKKPA